ncbi:MAG: hypothetical protein OIN87_00160 [Candidatus Methanoperedens sp.]|nr:hypothetical protein [Candidatus Methanoperedens sp.]
MEELEKLAFKCLRCGKLFFVRDGKLMRVRVGEDFKFAGMTMCPACVMER